MTKFNNSNNRGYNDVMSANVLRKKEKLLLFSMNLAVGHTTSHFYKFRRQSSERTISGSTGSTATIKGAL